MIDILLISAICAKLVDVAIAWFVNRILVGKITAGRAPQFPLAEKAGADNCLFAGAGRHDYDEK